jgi:hypothetical protein
VRSCSELRMSRDGREEQKTHFVGVGISNLRSAVSCSSSNGTTGDSGSNRSACVLGQ